VPAETGPTPGGGAPSLHLVAAFWISGGGSARLRRRWWLPPSGGAAPASAARSVLAVIGSLEAGWRDGARLRWLPGTEVVPAAAG
jgi:hypothetical protein